jgi:hypothetical protein
MRPQLDRLGSLIGLHTVRFGLLPLNRRLPYMPMHGYLLIDDRLVWVENLSAEIAISDPDEVAVYSTLTDRLWPAAVEGDEARALLRRVTDDLNP